MKSVTLILVLLALSPTTFAEDAVRKPMMISEARLPDGFPGPGPVGEVITKTYPAHRLARVRGGGGGNDGSFMKLFRHIEGPLTELLPGSTPEMRAGLARTLFSATHGIVSLGLEEKLGPAPDEVIAQALVVMTRSWVLGLPGAVAPR